MTPLLLKDRIAMPNARKAVSYIRSTLHGETLRTTALKAAIQLQKSGIYFDALAVRGTSGLLVGSVVAAMMNKDIIIVRKGERTHSFYDVEGMLEKPDARFIIFDDQVDSGRTAHDIFAAIRKHVIGERDAYGVISSHTCVGIFTYFQQWRVNAKYRLHHCTERDTESCFKHCIEIPIICLNPIDC